MTGILGGIRVIACTSAIVGSEAAALLGDLGAEIIKVEHRSAPDAIRIMKTLGDFPIDFPREKGMGDHTVLYELHNRNAKSISLDLRRLEGLEVLYRLVGNSDIFLINMTLRAVKKLGLTYDALSKVNPKLIYCALNGFGPKGPDADLGAFDFLGQARSGFATSMGEPDMPPMFMQVGPVDQLTSVMGSWGILAALLARERWGMGQEVSASMLGSALCTLLQTNLGIGCLLGTQTPNHGRVTRGQNPLRTYYCASDGKWVACAHHPAMPYFDTFCDMLGRKELVNDPRFSTEVSLAQNSVEFIAIADELFATRTRDEWLAEAARRRLNFAPINSVLDAMNDVQTIANDYVVEREHEKLGHVKFPGFPISFSRTPAVMKLDAPDAGGDTDWILSEIGGYTPGEIANLKNETIVEQFGDVERRTK